MLQERRTPELALRVAHSAEHVAQGRHKSAKVLPRYAKRTMRQVAQGAKKRRATRTEAGQMSE